MSSFLYFSRLFMDAKFGRRWLEKCWRDVGVGIFGEMHRSCLFFQHFQVRNDIGHHATGAGPDVEDTQSRFFV